MKPRAKFQQFSQDAETREEIGPEEEEEEEEREEEDVAGYVCVCLKSALVGFGVMFT